MGTVILPSSQTDKRNESEVEGMAVAGASSSFVGDDSTVASDSPIATNPDDDGHKEGGKKKKNRCLSCKKKVGLTGFTRRCGGLFCSIHRYSDKHDCTFDYKELGAEEIRKSNPVVVASKVQNLKAMKNKENMLTTPLWKKKNRRKNHSSLIFFLLTSKNSASQLQEAKNRNKKNPGPPPQKKKKKKKKK